MGGTFEGRGDAVRSRRKSADLGRVWRRRRREEGLSDAIGAPEGLARVGTGNAGGVTGGTASSVLLGALTIAPSPEEHPVPHDLLYDRGRRPHCHPSYLHLRTLGQCLPL